MFKYCSYSVLLVSIILTGCSRNPEAAKKAYVESGQAYMHKGKYQEAAIQFRNALKIDPRFVDGYAQLAEADSAMNQWRDAFAALRQPAAFVPSRLAVLLMLGQCYLA